MESIKDISNIHIKLRFHIVTGAPVFELSKKQLLFTKVNFIDTIQSFVYLYTLVTILARTECLKLKFICEPSIFLSGFNMLV